MRDTWLKFVFKLPKDLGSIIAVQSTFPGNKLVFGLIAIFWAKIDAQVTEHYHIP